MLIMLFRHIFVWMSSCGSGSGLLWWLVDFNMQFIMGGSQPCSCLVFHINLKEVHWIHFPSDVLDEHIISDFIQVQITPILPRCHNRQLQTQDSSLELPVTDADALGLRCGDSWNFKHWVWQSLKCLMLMSFDLRATPSEYWCKVANVW